MVPSLHACRPDVAVGGTAGRSLDAGVVRIAVQTASVAEIVTIVGCRGSGSAGCEN